MATNKRTLKAYVRFDGAGRIIPGSLILQRSKPKVGNWKETLAYECCNSSADCSINTYVENDYICDYFV
jgi:hypothetical protein